MDNGNSELLDCVFCDRISKGQFLYDFGEAVAFAPLNPVTLGHMLIVPRRHVEDFAANTVVSAETMRAAAWYTHHYVDSDCNLITSKGPAATQTIKHLHIHIVPRWKGDDLKLPWTGQKK